MTFLICLLICLPLFLLVAYIEDKSTEHKHDSIKMLIQEELNKNKYTVSNCIWYDPYYIATDINNDKIIIIHYDKKATEILSSKTINYHTTTFLTNGFQSNGNHWFLYSKNATLIFIDNDSKTVLILCSNDINNPKRIKFSDILSVELIMDSNVVTKKSFSNTIGRAVIGDCIAGSTGAIIGGTTAKSQSTDLCKFLQLAITIKEMSEPIIRIDICNSKDGIKDIKQSDVYKQALLLVKTFSIIIDSCLQSIKKHEEKSEKNICKEISDLAKLREQGIISEEEFITLKKRIIENTN